MRAAAATAALAVVVPLGLMALSPGRADEAAALERGAALYAENCAACHGAQLEGQPDWRSAGPGGLMPAPPHDASGHTWHHDDGLLFAYTKLGGAALMAKRGLEFNSGMPGFGDLLSDDEIWEILSYIKSTWPERERQFQAQRTAEANDTGKDTR